MIAPDNTLREVIDYISNKSGIDATEINSTSRILFDLGVDGDDASELIQDMSIKFGFDISEFNFRLYFHSEPHLFSFVGIILNAVLGIKKENLTVGDLASAVRSGVLRAPMFGSSN